MAVCAHSTAGSDKAKQIKDIKSLDTEFEGLHKGSQDFETQSFDGFTCGYDYVSDDFQEVKYLDADPFGLHGKVINAARNVIPAAR